jgi:hypothetical protein
MLELFLLCTHCPPAPFWRRRYRILLFLVPPVKWKEARESLSEKEKEERKKKEKTIGVLYVF